MSTPGLVPKSAPCAVASLAMASPPEDFVTSDPVIMNGCPVFAGTRVPIDDVLASLAAGIDMSRIRDSYPFLTQAHVQEARAYAEAHPGRNRPQSVSEAHPDWKVTKRRVVRQPRADRTPRLSDLTPELVSNIIEESVGVASDDESTTLSGWCIYEARLAHTPNLLSRHLVGWAEEAHEGRTSSAVVELDVVARTTRTETGRLYRLRGEPGPGGDARHVWDRFVRNNGATDVRDITDQVFSLVAQLGMSEGGDISFEPPMAQIALRPADLVDVTDISADDLLALKQALDSQLVPEEELERALSTDWLVENKDALGSSNKYVKEHGLPLAASSFTVEGEIVEVLPGMVLAHVRGANGVVYSLNPKTPGISFDALRAGQRVQCRVTVRFHRVLHAQVLLRN